MTHSLLSSPYAESSVDSSRNSGHSSPSHRRCPPQTSQSIDTSSALLSRIIVSSEAIFSPRSICPTNEADTLIRAASSDCVMPNSDRLSRTRFPIKSISAKRSIMRHHHSSNLEFLNLLYLEYPNLAREYHPIISLDRGWYSEYPEAGAGRSKHRWRAHNTDT